MSHMDQRMDFSNCIGFVPYVVLFFFALLGLVVLVLLDATMEKHHRLASEEHKQVHRSF